MKVILLFVKYHALKTVEKKLKNTKKLGFLVRYQLNQQNMLVACSGQTLKEWRTYQLKLIM